LTSWALDDTIEHHTKTFGHAPRNLDGSLADLNKLNFQREFARAQDRGLPDDEAAMAGIRRISFGQHRADRGYDDFKVIHEGPPVAVDLGGDLGLRYVPDNIGVLAKKWEP
jgi:hypothetical protein